MHRVAKSICISFLVLVSIVGSVRADLSAEFHGWLSYTSTKEVRYIDYFEDSLQVVTYGGWLKIDPITKGMRKITNASGIGTNDLHYIMKDHDGIVWLAGYGRLIKQSDGSFTPYLFFDRDNNLITIYTIEDDGDQLWLGTSRGLYLFSKFANGGQIEDFYFRFGGINPEPSVYDILIDGDSIWLATSGGLAVANKSNPDLLKSYINWQSFNTNNYPVLAVDTIRALALYRDTVHLGTTRSAFKLSLSAIDTTFTRLSTRLPITVRKMTLEGDSLFIYSSGGFFIKHGAAIYWNNTPTLPNYNFAAGRLVGLQHWLGMALDGIYLGDLTTYENFDDEGLPGNNVTALSANAAGDVVGCFDRNGAAIFDGQGWSSINLSIREWSTATVQDLLGNIWLSAWGGGLFQVTRDSIINYKEANSSLRGVVDSIDYVVVRDLAVSSSYLYTCQFISRENNNVSIMNLFDHSQWISFGMSDGVMMEGVLSIDFTDRYFAVGTENNGVYYYYYGTNPFDKSDDSAVNFREDNTRLGSNNVNVVRFDRNGILWVGTKYGLSRYDPGIERFINVLLPANFGPEVTALAFDRRGNIWMGSRRGLAKYNSVSGTIDVYTTLNSGLTDNIINALMINPVTNDIWVGTPAGVSRLSSPIGAPTSDITQVIAFPNPFRVSGGGEYLSFNYNGEATVRIFTASGEKVREFNINVPWDGKNQQGQALATGVYIFLLTAEDGSVGRGKILLIRE